MTEALSNHVAALLLESSLPESLQEKLINMDTAFNCMGITWLNKDGSYLLMLIEEIEPGNIKTATFAKTAEEYETQKHIF
jgi:hypothetical protein